MEPNAPYPASTGAAPFAAIVDGTPHRLVFVDNDHVIRYLNRAAEAWYYGRRGYAELVGKSLFDCHNADSRARVLELYERLRRGEDEVFVRVTPWKERATMVAVRDRDGRLLGYWERFEPPAAGTPSAA